MKVGNAGAAPKNKRTQIALSRKCHLYSKTDQWLQDHGLNKSRRSAPQDQRNPQRRSFEEELYCYSTAARSLGDTVAPHHTASGPR